VVQKTKAHQLVRALELRHRDRDDFFLTEVKSGPTWFDNNMIKLDALAIKKSWKTPLFTGYEIKVSRQDFLNDRKWPGYLKYCHEFSFVCPTGLIQPEELPKEVGLVYFNPDRETLYTKRKAVYRTIDIPPEMLMYIIMSKLDSDRHPFFSSQRERIEAYLADKESKRTLALSYNNKMMKELLELEKKNRDASHNIERLKSKAEMYDKIYKVLNDCGVKTYSWDDSWIDHLKEQLKTSVSPSMKLALERIKNETEQLLKITKEESDD
jgi:hypothetical protein